MGLSMSDPLKEDTRPKKNTLKRMRLYQVLKILKKKDARLKKGNTLQTNSLCEYVLQELDGQNLDKIANTLNMLLEKILDRKKEIEEISESRLILQRDNEGRLGEVVSQNLLEENTNLSSDTNVEYNGTQQDGIEDPIPKAYATLDSHYKEMPSRLVVNSDNVQDGIVHSVTKADAMEDSHDKEITFPVVINKNRNGKYVAGVIFVGNNNICQINGTDLMKNTDKEADNKLMVIMRRELFALKTSNTILERENRILRRRSINTANYGKKPISHLVTGRRFCPSQKSNSFPSRTVNPGSVKVWSKW
ncbi:hypothetical protein CHS0354_032771 [Potamilus streckersoni]|uniref:Uncharacterized protein n=1 Tax=Potamilus streckersoni TaxID=2493646 RepID=A0AAE0VM79_9BIVA|nr:hypothetical protein CHS0354_032771 [Potamilus streckersoni]